MNSSTKYNEVYAAGEIVEIEAEYSKGPSRIIPFVISCLNEDGTAPYKPKYLHIKAWDRMAELVRPLQKGQRVQVKVTLSSKRNPNHPGLWFHVVGLRELKIM